MTTNTTDGKVTLVLDKQDVRLLLAVLNDTYAHRVEEFKEDLIETLEAGGKSHE